MQLTLPLGRKLLARNNLQPSRQLHVRLGPQPPSLQPPLRARLRHRRAVRQPRRARPARHEQIPRVPLLRLHSRILMGYVTPAALYTREPARDVQVEGINHRVLRHVFDLVVLRVRVRHVGILVVVVEPVLRGREGFVRVSAQEVEGVAALVQEHGEVPVDAVEHCDVAVPIVGVASVGVGEGDHVPDPLAGLHGQAAEEVDHIAEGVGGGCVTAEDPGGGAVVVVDVECFYVEGVETGILGHGLAVGRDPAGAPLVPCAGGWLQVVKEALLEVVEVGMERWFGQLSMGQGGKDAERCHGGGSMHSD